MCNTICSNIDKGCILGEENEDTKKCSESIEFGESDDFCICAEKRIINTQNWEGFLEKGETSQIVVYDAGVMQRGNLLIEVQNAK